MTWLAAALILSGAAAAQASQYATVSCLVSKCHPVISVKRYLHGPVGSGSCEVCHQVSHWAEGKHPSLLTRADAEKCYFCHEEAKALTRQKHVHTPVAKGECTACHDPHQSDNPFLLVNGKKEGAAKPSDLCFSCHDAARAYWKTGFHGAVAFLDCISCHEPHSSPFAYQLTKYVRTVYIRDYLAMGADDIAKKEYARALENLSLVLTIDPREVSALMMSARACLALNDPEGAKTYIDRLLEINPLNAETYYLRGLMAAAKKETYQAISYVQQSLSLKPEYPEALLKLGQLQITNKLYSEALSTLTKAAGGSSVSPEVHLYLSDVYQALGRAGEAAKEKRIYQDLKDKPAR